MRVAIIGGDRRMLYAAKAFLQDTDQVVIGGFDSAELPDHMVSLSVGDALEGADLAVLPVRPLKEGMLNAPFSSQQLPLSELAVLIGTKPVFSGDIASLRGMLRGALYDYTAQEEFAVRNAVLTAEGAIGLLVQQWEGAIFCARALVLGYGRIGRIAARYLRALGADVTVAVRRDDARAWVQAEGMHSCDYSLKEINTFDIVLNTVPAPVVNADCVDRIRQGAVIVDLASSPGGVDGARAEQRGLSFIHALALPGKTAPAAAGRIIKDTICHIIKEENGGKDNCGLCDDRLLLHL